MSRKLSDAAEMSRRRLNWRAGLGAAFAVLAGGAVCQSNAAAPPNGLTMALLAVLMAVMLVLGLRQSSGDVPRRAGSDDAERASATLSVQVVPVWQRNVEAARKESERSMGGLLESFANVSNRLDTALATDDGRMALEFGAADDLMQRHRPEIERLSQTTQLALQIKDALAQGVADLSNALAELGVLAKEVQSIGRATHLLAMNASVEASRAGAAGGGFVVVALEVRRLATQSREVASQIGRRIAEMQERIKTVARDAARHDTDDDEIRRCVDEAARATVLAVLGSVADFSRSSRTLRETSQAVQAEIEKISMSLQSQDRLSQMLISATDDMDRYVRWLKGEPDLATATPTLWLERLEASYTMEEMRASHHGTVKVDAAPAVEFF